MTDELNKVPTDITAADPLKAPAADAPAATAAATAAPEVKPSPEAKAAPASSKIVTGDDVQGKYWQKIGDIISEAWEREVQQRRIWQPPHYVGFKLLAVLVAFMLWAYVTVSQNPLTDGVFTVPVSIYNLSEELAPPDSSYQVQIRVQGSSSVISNLSSRDFEAYVDLEGMQEGEATAEIRVRLPETVSLVYQSQNELSLTLEKSLSAGFSVQPLVSGKAAANYQQLQAVLSPEIVTLYGSSSRMEQVAQVCVSVDIEGSSSNFNKNLPVQVLDSEGKDISQYFTVSPSSVSVMVPIVYRQPESSVSVRAKLVGETAGEHQISRVVVEPATVTIYGELAALEQVYYLETAAIDISGLSATRSYQVPLTLPEGITASAEQVTVVVQIDSVRSAAVTRELVQVRNLPDGFSAALPAGLSCMVNLSGPGSVIDALEAEAVLLYVDCSTVTAAGEYQLPLQVRLPSGLTLDAISPESVTVTVSSTAGDTGDTGDDTADTTDTSDTSDTAE